MPDNQRPILDGRNLSYELDAFDGAKSSGGVAQFDFSYRGFRFSVRAEESGDGLAHLKVTADIGRMPFSAEAPAARSGLSAIILHANGLLGRIFQLTGERIVLARSFTIETPATTTRLLTVLSGFLIPLSPYLDLISVYHEPGGERLKPEWRRPSRQGQALPGKFPAPKALPSR